MLKTKHSTSGAKSVSLKTGYNIDHKVLFTSKGLLLFSLKIQAMVTFDAAVIAHRQNNLYALKINAINRQQMLKSANILT